jgi:hypothetical protein
MPLWMSSSCRLCVGWGCDDPIDFVGDVSLEATDSFAVGLAFGDAAGEVVAGTGVPAQPAQADAVERKIGLSVTAAVEAATTGLAGGCLPGG